MTTPKAKIEPAAPARERYVAATGGRKTANAQARLFRSGEGVTINKRPLDTYFRLPKHRVAVLAPLVLTQLDKGVRIEVTVSGGGTNAQAEAVRNAIAHTLIKIDAALRPKLKHAGYLTRDARMVERKKYGLKKARRAPQWAKR